MHLLNQREAAAFLRLSERTLERFHLTGDGPLYMKAGRRVTYRREDLDRWVAARARIGGTQMIFSQHASVRAQQRGISSAQLYAIAAHGDKEIHRGGGCYAVWISKETMRRLGPATPEGVSTDRLKGLIILHSGDNTLVTTFRNRRDKAYRRRSPGALP